jgi:ubiquinone/menaquinone biosynthesis C-methylase UbiE
MIVFDFVVMSEVIEHLNEVELDSSIREAVRVLKRKGFLIVTVPFEENFPTNDVICPHCGKKFHRWGHQQSFSMSRLRRLLEDKGHAVERVETRCFPDWSRKGMANAMKSCIRYIFGRFRVVIAQPSIFLEAVKS